VGIPRGGGKLTPEGTEDYVRRESKSSGKEKKILKVRPKRQVSDQERHDVAGRGKNSRGKLQRRLQDKSRASLTRV